MTMLPFDPPPAVLAGHQLVLVTSAARLGWWAECECGWLGPGHLSEVRAINSHVEHQRRQVGR